jgi:hypothetical protein
VYPCLPGHLYLRKLPHRSNPSRYGTYLVLLIRINAVINCSLPPYGAAVSIPGSARVRTL